MIDLDRRPQQLADDLDMSSIGSADQPGAVIAVQAVYIGAGAQGQPKQLEPAIRRRDEVRALLVRSFTFTSAPAAIRTSAITMLSR